MNTNFFSEKDLPPLPDAEHSYYCCGEVKPTGGYTDEQMRAYALDFANACLKKLCEQEPLGYACIDDLMVAKVTGHCDVEILDEPANEYHVPVYAAPMPAANESEAVAALRDVTALLAWLHCGEKWSKDVRTHNPREAIEAARAVLAGEPVTKGEPATGKQDLQVERAAQDEREEFHAWFSNYADPHSGRIERNIKRKAAWDAWQARAALAQTQASGKAEKYCDDHCTWLDHDPKCVIGGKAAPSDADIIHIAARTVPAFTNRDALTFARALLERYGNASKDGAMAAGRKR